MTMPQNSPRNKTNAFIGMVRQYSSSWPIGVNQSCGVLPANLALVLDVGTVLVSALLVTELCRFGTLPLHMGVSSFRPGLLFKIGRHSTEGCFTVTTMALTSFKL